MAREGDLDTRARAQNAYRGYILREALRAFSVGVRERPTVGPVPPGDFEMVEMTIEEEAGAILEAEMANDLSLLRRYYEAVHKKE
jgi:hypothetical protein